MKTRTLNFIVIAAIPILMTGCSKQISYNKDIKPILSSSCLMCHSGSGEGYVKSGFSVENYNTIMKGTKLGPVIVPGNSLSSTLFRLVSHNTDPKIQMPPHHDESLADGKLKPLSRAQVETIALWIDQGAKNN